MKPEVKEAIYIRQRETELNKDGGTDLPAICIHALSHDLEGNLG